VVLAIVEANTLAVAAVAGGEVLAGMPKVPRMDMLVMGGRVLPPLYRGRNERTPQAAVAGVNTERRSILLALGGTVLVGMEEVRLMVWTQYFMVRVVEVRGW